MGSAVLPCQWSTTEPKRSIGSSIQNQTLKMNTLETAQLLEAAEAWALGHGVVMRDAHGAIHHAPFSLLPVRLPRASFEHVQSLCTIFNSLVCVEQQSPSATILRIIWLIG